MCSVVLMMNEVKLFQGDCLTIMPQLAEQGIKVDMVLTDPPYGTTKCKWDSIIPFEPMWECLDSITNPNTPIALFGSEPFSTMLRYSNIKQFRYDWIWEKNNSGNFQLCNKQPLKYFELISVFYKKMPLYNPQGLVELEEPLKQSNKNKGGKLGHLGSEKKRTHYEQKYTNYPSSIIKFKRPPKMIHPTQKPTALLEYLIKTYTNKDDLVLDFTMGSGSTGVACLQTNRNFIGIELEPKYYEIAKKRINEAKAQRRLI